jgi:hypothetical protein
MDEEIVPTDPNLRCIVDIKRVGTAVDAFANANIGNVFDDFLQQRAPCRKGRIIRLLRAV